MTIASIPDRRVGAIRDHHHDCRVQAAIPGSVDQRLQIAAATGDEDPQSPIGISGVHFQGRLT
jgi:hypothetical protein